MYVKAESGKTWVYTAMAEQFAKEHQLVERKENTIAMYGDIELQEYGVKAWRDKGYIKQLPINEVVTND